MTNKELLSLIQTLIEVGHLHQKVIRRLDSDVLELSSDMSLVMEAVAGLIMRVDTLENASSGTSENAESDVEVTSR